MTSEESRSAIGQIYHNSELAFRKAGELLLFAMLAAFFGVLALLKRVMRA